MEKNKKFGYIYKLTMIPTGKIYIGKREKPEVDQRYFGSGKLWKQDLKKYGKENIDVEILDWAYSRAELNEKEVYWIKEFNSQDKEIGYNIHCGGSGGNMVGDSELWSQMHKGELNGRFGKEVSQETRDKISLANSGKIRSQETKDKISASTKGKKKPKSYSEKLSQRLKGVPKSQEVKDKISKKLKGSSWGHHSQESKNKISRALMGHEGLKGENNPMYGKHHSEEVIEKLRAQQKGRFVGKNNPRARKVQCIETGIVYDTIKEAEENTGASHIGSVCRGCQEVSSKIKLHWRYVEDED